MVESSINSNYNIIKQFFFQFISLFWYISVKTLQNP